MLTTQFSERIWNSHLLMWPHYGWPMDVEKLLIQSGGVKTLMGCLNGIEAIRKLRNRELEANEQLNAKDQNLSHFPIPDCLPKTQEELEEEEEARMPDSPFTRLLRSKGKSPAWCSVPPDNETD
ncbi:CCG-binding protein 1-like protein [Cinnamomum micranthum f. kanehirae]|uniref:CCG-binding protein 1-like protein n=1 Tax=Cinnamomum micranthum f. kanehirae TaxID=337451 RepID=A0A443N4V1_9MAGN|nr:CCG-binding protein 1-like protein [Cinnamomum micranthum f. kanehirae]